VVPQEQQHEIIARIRAEIDLMSSEVSECKETSSAIELAETTQDVDSAKVLIVSGLNDFSKEEWRHLDLLRSRLNRNRACVLVLSPEGAEKLVENAPNFSSWIGGSIWQVDLEAESLSEEERLARLRDLREWSGLTDEEVLRRARERTLPNEPEFSEWLVLLGRVDLIGN
jgi:hypothetical protein